MKPIFATLATGEIVELAKDCGCVDHAGPHWLYANDKWRERNEDLEEKVRTGSPEVSFYARMGLVQEESARLTQRLYAFNARGIKQVHREDPSI